MQQSMTGYGRSETSNNKYLIKCEVKTLNSKFLDFSPRIPKELNSKEPDIRVLVSESLKRGKVIFTLEVEMNSDSGEAIHVDEKLFKAYYDKFQELSKIVNASDESLLKIALESPDVIKQQEISMEEVLWEDVKKTIKSTLHNCVEFRKNEGLHLEKKLYEYIQEIRQGLKKIELFDKQRSISIRSKLEKSIDEIRDKVKLDENRFEQELIFYLERLDISEEKVRLAQHLAYFDEILKKEDVSGKKLGFIAQEIGREINTIGSKANDAEIQRVVVSMKDELEKIKEQVLNII